MSFRKDVLEAGLYLVATPIGTARDITLRALDILASADVLAAEDTRSLRHLMQIHGVPLGDRQIISYHDQNGPQMRPRLMAALREGKSIAYTSEAGTPLVADPGYALVKEVQEAGIAVTSAPGPSAVITALSIAGMPTDRFLFLGFAPTTSKARQSFLKKFGACEATLVLYESPKRIDKLLADCLAVFGPEREVAICRELTKRFEEVRKASLGEIDARLEDMPRKGEIVVLIDRDTGTGHDPKLLDQMLKEALETMRVKDAAQHISAELNLPRRDVYQRALELSKSD